MIYIVSLCAKVKQTAKVFVLCVFLVFVLCCNYYKFMLFVCVCCRIQDHARAYVRAYVCWYICRK